MHAVTSLWYVGGMLAVTLHVTLFLKYDVAYVNNVYRFDCAQCVVVVMGIPPHWFKPSPTLHGSSFGFLYRIEKNPH